MKKISWLVFVFLVLPGLSFAQIEVEVLSLEISAVVPRNAIRLPVAQVRLSAVGSNMGVSEIVYNHRGMSASSDFGRMWAQSDSYKRSLRTRVQTSGVVRFYFMRPMIILDGESEVVTIFASLNMKKGSSGRTFEFVLDDIVAVEASLETRITGRRSGAYRRVLRRF